MSADRDRNTDDQAPQAGGMAQEAPHKLASNARGTPRQSRAHQHETAAPPTLFGDEGAHHSPPEASTIDEGPQGHRKRLRQRFMNGGPDALPDYELLEMILFRVFPRGDTKPLAKRLIARFGSFAQVINAPVEHLTEVEGLGARGAEELKLVRAAAVRTMRGEIMKKPLLTTWSAVVDYCRAVQGFDLEERFRVIFLDKRNQLIADEVQSTGTVDHTPVYIREVVHRALTLRASAILLVHNHPSGDPTPSRADIEMTRAIADAGRPLGITVHDHIIVGRDGFASFRQLKLI